jgi:hypothetical protein
MLAIMLLVEQFIAIHDIDFSDSYAAMARYVARAARRKAPKCDILCFGDSLLKMGLVPQVVESELGKPAINLAMVGAQPPASYFLLRHAIESGARPSAVLIDFKASCLVNSPRDNERQWPEILSLAECGELAWTMRDAAFLGNLVVSRLVPSITSRREIRTDILLALQGQSPPSRAYLPIFWRNWNVNRGAQVMPKDPIMRSDPKYLIKEVYFPDQWSCEPTSVAYIRRFLKLAAAHKIPVFWLLPPIRPDVQAKREQSGLDALYLRLVHHYESRFSNLVVVDGRHSGFEETVFQDPSHLDYEGASAYSAAVAHVLRAYLGRPSIEGRRWVELPAYRPFNPGLHKVPMEDFEQSRIAIESNDQQRRL